MTTSRLAGAGDVPAGAGLLSMAPTPPAPADPPEPRIVRCASCRIRPADVLLPFPASIPQGLPAQVFPLCGSCAELGTGYEEWLDAGLIQ